MAANGTLNSQWATTTDAASSSNVPSNVRTALYHATVGKVQSVLSMLPKFEPKDLNEVNRSYQGGAMRIPFTLGAEITAEQMRRIEQELSSMHATVSVTSDLSGPQMIVSVDPKHAMETARRLQSLRNARTTSASCSLLLCMVIATFLLVLYIHFSIPAAKKLEFARTYFPPAEQFLMYLARISQGAAAHATAGHGTNGST